MPVVSLYLDHAFQVGGKRASTTSSAAGRAVGFKSGRSQSPSSDLKDKRSRKHDSVNDGNADSGGFIFIGH